jgi:hypothetical protein
MQKLYYIILIVTFAFNCKAQTCFEITSEAVINTKDTLFLTYSIKNTSATSINIVYSNIYNCVCNRNWNLEIIDSLGTKYVFDVSHKMRFLVRSDYTALSKDSSILIKFILLKDNFCEYLDNVMPAIYPYAEVSVIKYPLSIKLKYTNNGEYYNFRWTNKPKKLENATFQCESEEIKIYK